MLQPHIRDFHIKDAVLELKRGGRVAGLPKNLDSEMVGIYRVSAPCAPRLVEVAGELVEEEAVCR